MRNRMRNQTFADFGEIGLLSDCLVKRLPISEKSAYSRNRVAVRRPLVTDLVIRGQSVISQQMTATNPS